MSSLIQRRSLYCPFPISFPWSRCPDGVFPSPHHGIYSLGTRHSGAHRGTGTYPYYPLLPPSPHHCIYSLGTWHSGAHRGTGSIFIPFHSSSFPSYSLLQIVLYLFLFIFLIYLFLIFSTFRRLLSMVVTKSFSLLPSFIPSSPTLSIHPSTPH